MNKLLLLNDLSKLLMLNTCDLHDGYDLDADGNWDSLCVVSTVGAISIHYQVAVTGVEIMGCKKLVDIFNLIQKKLGHKS
ncbi:hypothetical protein [Legionella sp. CNM-4043-24]|uniref:hypothetical protein n=1 Tax=Legionella sp. CNM-4043-24 TaxID=3421646 RepID=UPI00403AD2D8